jgi:hypothetical protein
MNAKKVSYAIICGAAIVGLLGVVLSACSSSSTTATGYVQVERLGRPAINEGLVISNANLNAFNSVAPSVDLTPAAAAVVTEASAVLTLIFRAATNAGLTPAATADVAGGFLPDVMRIDTSLSLASSVNAGAYTPASGGMGSTQAAVANAANAYFHLATGTASGTSKPPILVGGRKITDDVVNITLSYLFNSNNGANVTDYLTPGLPYNHGVFYYGWGVSSCTGAGAQPTASLNSGAPGHHCLNGQTVPYGAATWPFLASANITVP